MDINTPDRGFLIGEQSPTKYMGLTDYIKETRVEMKHVTWPSRKQAIAFTAVVILISIGVALYLGFFDFLFTLGLGKII